MATLTNGLAVVNLIDFSGETQEHSLYVATPSAANFAAQEALYDAYMTALLNITSLNVLKKSWGKAVREAPANFPLSSDAQREQQWLVQYIDNTTTQRYSHRIGGNVRTGNLLPASDFADLAATDIAAYVTAFEAFAKSPAGNSVSISSIVNVGKNDRRPPTR